MAEKAKIRNGYSGRMIFLAVIALALGGWFLYDGLVGYPAKQQIAEKFEQINQKYGQDYAKHWEKLRRKHHWPVSPTIVTDSDIQTQFYYAIPCLIFGVMSAGGFFLMNRRWIEADDEGLKTSRGQHARWDQITSVDKRRWDKKGIAIVHYDHNGKDQRITLDDWKYDPAATAAILQRVEVHLGVADDAAEDSPTPVDGESAPAH